MMRMRAALFAVLCLPWAFLVTAADFLWGSALGYLVVPPVIWWTVWRFSRRGWFGWMALGLVVSYLISMAMVWYLDGAWDYFFKPFNQVIIMNSWSVVFVTGVLLTYFYRRVLQKARESA